VRRTLLVSDQNVPHGIVPREGIVYRHDRAAGISEHGSEAEIGQGTYYSISPGSQGMAGSRLV
jgi:hypothetical protein